MAYGYRFNTVLRGLLYGKLGKRLSGIQDTTRG